MRNVSTREVRHLQPQSVGGHYHIGISLAVHQELIPFPIVRFSPERRETPRNIVRADARVVLASRMVDSVNGCDY